MHVDASITNLWSMTCALTLYTVQWHSSPQQMCSGAVSTAVKQFCSWHRHLLTPGNVQKLITATVQHGRTCRLNGMLCPQIGNLIAQEFSCSVHTCMPVTQKQMPMLAVVTMHNRMQMTALLAAGLPACQSCFWQAHR